MTQKKLSLAQLKVSSFITTINKGNHIKGGVYILTTGSSTDETKEFICAGKP